MPANAPILLPMEEATDDAAEDADDAAEEAEEEAEDEEALDDEDEEEEEELLSEFVCCSCSLSFFLEERPLGSSKVSETRKLSPTPCIWFS
ncbi:MAG: hypothetical protein IJR88_02855 [Clostridia bacterium]|nr:hypothetical protein [Clostridia bacterium]